MASPALESRAESSPRTFERHDGDLDSSAVQPPQPLWLGLALLVAEVEARREDPQAQVGVPPQEVGHVPRTVVAGAPRREPGDAVAPPRVQIPVRDVAKEEQLHVASGLGREQRLGMVTDLDCPAGLLREPIRARGTATLKQESADSTPQLSPVTLSALVSVHWGERTSVHVTGGVSARKGKGIRGLGLSSPSGLTRGWRRS